MADHSPTHTPREASTDELPISTRPPGDETRRLPAPPGDDLDRTDRLAPATDPTRQTPTIRIDEQVADRPAPYRELSPAEALDLARRGPRRANDGSAPDTPGRPPARPPG